MIELMSKELDWSEAKVTTVVESKPESQGNSITEEEQKKQVCKFLKIGKCQYGKSGKRPDQQGKICSYSHPQVCKNHEIQGKCMNNRCKKLHLSLCRRFMESQNCIFGERCK